MKNYTVGIIGNGRFGGLLYTVFLSHSDNFHPKIYSRSNEVDNQKFFSLEDVCNCDIVIPSVPISNFEEQIESIKDMIKPESLVVDVCSVNVHPEKVLLKYLATSIDILSTHPMFGPDGTKNGTFFEHLKFIFHNTRISNAERAEQFLEFWKQLGCDMIEMTPEEHDRQAAYTHAYAFLIGKIGMKLNVRRNQISTKGFEGILYNQEAVENDTGQLFHDMMTYNPFAKEMREKVVSAMKEIEEDLKP